MKAIVQDRYGPPEEVLELREINRPVPRDDEVLIQVRAASVHPDVWHAVTGRPYVLRLMGSGLFKPKNPIPGMDLAGSVEAVGKAVTSFEAGDEVFGETHVQHVWRNGGSYAEFAAVPQEALALKPANITFEQAASVATSGIIALLNLDGGGKIQAGQQVLINGAGGGVGSVAVQLAKAYGATVTGIDSAVKVEMIRSLGADEVIDYTSENFLNRDERYDLILDVASTLSFSDCRRALTPAGTYVRIGHDHFGAAGSRTFGTLPQFLGLVARSPFVRQLPDLSFSVPEKRESLAALREFLEMGKLTPVVGRTYPLSAVIEAMGDLQEGRVCGKIVITPKTAELRNSGRVQ